MCGHAYEKPDLYWRLSPMRYAHKARTPTLVTQGGDDARCPIGQSEDLYVTIMCSGDTPAELVIYPKGSHHFYEDGRPSHRLDFVNRLVEWMQRWVSVRSKDGALDAAQHRHAA
jgi:dipeptidyl aminopeptidase/acylaminoacyl peptidase